MPAWRNSYEICGLRLLITSSAGNPAPFLPPQTEDFVSNGDAHLSIEFFEDDRAAADPLKYFFPPKFSLVKEDTQFAFMGINGKERQLGTISAERDRGRMGLPCLDRPWRIAEEREFVEEALQGFLRAALQCRLLAECGTFLHAAGIAMNGKGYAFVGHTRAGKTTLSRHFPASNLLGDDLVAIRETEGFMLFGTPWPGREGGRVGSGGVPLKAIFNLDRERPKGLAHMAPAEAVAELAVNAPRLGHAGEEAELLGIFSSAALALPIYNLSLGLHDDVHAWLEGFEKKEEQP
ncbi:MAG: hypothetical protein A2W01_04240 [Candidatus Solincola sediminis]|nr:MAG: hypothetical protein A2W01_04240 [Candidatus Solincola sediminis]